MLQSIEIQRSQSPSLMKCLCLLSGAQKADRVVLTSGGNLRCKHIAHMVGLNTAIDITASTEKVFQLCESKMAATVAIPAIGTGTVITAISVIYHSLLWEDIFIHMKHIADVWPKPHNSKIFN